MGILNICKEKKFLLIVKKKKKHRCFGCTLDILQLGVPMENNMLLHKNTLLSSIVA